MPKEYIVTEATQRRTDEMGGCREAVRIGWERGRWVQLATVLKTETEGAPFEILADADQGQFIDLDRHSINEVIRVLRRARDQAYGRDE